MTTALSSGGGCVVRGGGSKSGHRLWGPQQAQVGRTFEAEFAQFKAAALDVISVGGKCALEWPDKSQYWNHPNVQSFLKEWGFASTPIKAASLGINKPGYWRVASNNIALLKSLQTTFDKSNKGKVFQRLELVPGKVDVAEVQGPSGAVATKPGVPCSAVTDSASFPIKLSAVAMAAVMEQIKEGRVMDSEIPAMPLIPLDHPGFDAIHREKLDDPILPFNAMVSRAVPPKEANQNPLARAAMDSEMKGLREHGVWNEKKMRERADVLKEARVRGEKVHHGRVFLICHEKGSEMPEGHPDRKMKARAVFQGNNVKDEFWDQAIFGELPSSPAAIEAAKAADAAGLLPGHKCQTCDAEKAYIQSKLGGIKTWVELPHEYWPQEWKDRHKLTEGHPNKLYCPVVPLEYALYGHPDAGGYWEKHCEGHLLKIGFTKVPGWRSCFYHKRLRCFLVVYVDDFKMAGPAESLPEAWRLITAGIKTDEPQEASKYLGCDHYVTTEKRNGKTVRQLRYDMSNFFKSCVTAYLELAGPNAPKLRSAATPFLEEVDDEKVGEGKLQSIAASILMKVLYGARMVRFDLLKAVNYLASRITKWSPECDRRLRRLMCYIDSTAESELIGWVGDAPEDLVLWLFADADFAGCKVTLRSTSGAFLALSGPNTFFPLGAHSRKQTCVPHSTPEAELVAADAALRLEGLPAIDLWDVILDRSVVLKFWEDNDAAIKIMLSGRNPTMRHMARTHRVDTMWLHETCTGNGEALIERILKLKLELERLEEKQALLEKGQGNAKDTVQLEYCESNKMAADIFTKPFVNADKWGEVCELIGIEVKHKKPIWGEWGTKAERGDKEKSPEVKEARELSKEEKAANKERAKERAAKGIREAKEREKKEAERQAESLRVGGG